MILYEYPCNERVRALLRVEYLFDRLFFFQKGADAYHHQIAVATLFDLLEICDRTDLRGAVLQDLERQRGALANLQSHPGVDEALLNEKLEEICSASNALASLGRIGQVLRDNEWLASLRGRLTIPGGTSQIDMPSYYAWQLKPTDVRAKDLHDWAMPFMPLYRGLSLILSMLRESGDTEDCVATDGQYQEMLSGKRFQLLRVWVAEDCLAFPEMSANKYVIWVRFSRQDNELRPQSVDQDIAFRLARCNVG